jgi:hypothetical protein
VLFFHDNSKDSLFPRGHGTGAVLVSQKVGFVMAKMETNSDATYSSKQNQSS